jgi:hypothetical protein
VNPSNFLSVAAVLFADFCVSFIAGFLPLRVLMGTTLVPGSRRGGGFSETARSLPG